MSSFPRDNTTSERKGPSSSVVKQEVDALMRHNKSDFTALQQLRNKYKDEELVNAIFDNYKDRLKFLSAKARKFKQLIYDKYAPQNIAYEELIKKAKRYAKKYELSDDEFQMFITLSLTDRGITGDFGTYSLPTTEMARTLGYDAVALGANRLNVKPTELEVVNDIIKLYGQTKSLHSQVVIQSLTYRDCAPEAIRGSMDYAKHNWYSYVHPVIAALFFPKVRMLDEQMLIANLGFIVKCKHEGLQLITKPDYDLYWSLIADPNEHVCHINTPIKDLYNRFVLQTKVWDAVLNLRQGKYYNDRLNDFIVTIDACRNNIYDAPDLTYVKDEGTILRRLLAAFSIRPTLVSTSRMYGLLGASSYGFNTSPLSATGITQVTTVPMINLRLPVNISNTNSFAVTLEDSLSQPQWFIEHKMLIPKTQQIMHSREIIFFYVGRRFQHINFTRLNTPYNFTALPMTVAGWEKLNDTIVNFQNTMTILNDTYELRSVVMVERSAFKKNLIVGSSAAIRIPPGLTDEAGVEETIILYDPQGAGEQFQDDRWKRTDTNVAGFSARKAITWLPSHATYNDSNDESFYQRASTRGTIFMYQKTSEIICDPDRGFISF